jgi:hypothetical protein
LRDAWTIGFQALIWRRYLKGNFDDRASHGRGCANHFNEAHMFKVELRVGARIITA